MATVIFYEKPGCINNTKQKALLLAAGHQVQAENLLTQPWTSENLRRFFGSKSVVEWFNPSAPRIKSGEVIPAELEEETAIALMIADPLLIRRPLIQVGEVYDVGFDAAKLNDWLGLTPLATGDVDLETCPRSH